MQNYWIICCLSLCFHQYFSYKTCMACGKISDLGGSFQSVFPWGLWGRLTSLVINFSVPSGCLRLWGEGGVHELFSIFGKYLDYYNKVLGLIKCQVLLLWVDLYQLDGNTYYLNWIALADSFLGLCFVNGRRAHCLIESLFPNYLGVHGWIVKGSWMDSAWEAAANDVTRCPLSTAQWPVGQNLSKQEDPELNTMVEIF